MHFTITLANDQLDAQIFNTFITILYMYMFRAISCSSSGRQIVFIQHMLSSLSVSDRPVHKCRGRSITESDSGFGGLDVACWPLVPKFAGSHPAEAFGLLGRKKSSASPPSEEK